MNVQSDALEDCLLMVDGATKDDPNLPTLEEMKDPDMNFIDDEGIRTNILVAKPAGISRLPEWAPEWCHEALGEESMELEAAVTSKTKEACVDKSAKLEALRTSVRRQTELEAIAADEFQLRARRAPRARLGR